VRHFSGALLFGRLLSSPTNVKLGWKSLPGTNTLAYYKNPYITDKESFITLGPGYIRLRKLKKDKKVCFLCKSIKEDY
jgi:hypothetical protein